MTQPLYHPLTAAELAPKGLRSKDGRRRRHRAHEQTPLEALARDHNWKRGLILALERNAQTLVHAVAPESDSLITTVARLTAALLRWNEQTYEHARAGIVTGDALYRNFDRASRS